MGGLEVNKAAAAVLMAGIAFVGSGLIADALVRPVQLHETAIKVEGVQTAAAPAADAPAAPAAPIGVLLASADAGAGETVAKRLCVSCHNFEEGGKNGVGPRLYGVMGAPKARLDDYQYSASLKGKGGAWTYEDMSAWLLNPRGYVSGTKMAFAGIANDKTRADVVLYLRNLAGTPQPLPDAAATPVAAPGGAPAPTGEGPANAPSTGAESTPRPSGSGPDAPVEGGTRPQGSQVTGPQGQGQVQGQQTSQPSPSLNQSQAETNQSQQPPQAQQVAPGASVEGAEGGTRSQQGRVVGPTGQGQVQGQQTSQPSPSLNQSQAETNQSQQPPQAQQAQ